MKNSQKYMTALKTGSFLRSRIFVGGQNVSALWNYERESYC